MDKIREFRPRAEECRALAERAADGFVQAALLDVADTWDSLADQREQLAKWAKNRKAR